MAKDPTIPPELPTGPARTLGPRAAVAVGVLCVLLAVVTVWTVPRPTGDLYVALAAGRDIMNGKLGAEDDWCYTTKGRVWVNQNWGTHMLYYFFYQAFGGLAEDDPAVDKGALGGPAANEVDPGETGLLVLKLLLLLTGATFLAFACHRRGAGWPVSLMVAGGIIAAGRSFIDLRPNLTTLMFVPVMLHMLFWTADKPRRIWWVMIVFGVIWANLHGGFFLGLLTMGFWALCMIVPGMFQEKLLRSMLWGLLWVLGIALLALLMCAAGDAAKSTTYAVVGLVLGGGLAADVLLVLRKHTGQGSAGQALTDCGTALGRAIGPRWQYLAATAGAFVLAGVATPFGVHNLFTRDYASLKMTFSEIWNLSHPFVVMAGKDSDLWQSVIEWNSIFTARARTFGTTWEFFSIVGLFAALVPLNVLVKLGRKKKMDPEDLLLLLAIMVLAVAVFVQAKPVYTKFGRLVSAYYADPGRLAHLRGTTEQRAGWLVVLIVYPVIGLLALGAGVAAIGDVFIRRNKMTRFSATRIGLLVFEVAMAVGGIKLAFGARRFIPLSLILLAPLLVRRVAWLLSNFGRSLPAIVFGAVVLAVIGIQTHSNALRYLPSSPLVRYRSMLKNVIVYEQFPPGARSFVNDNALSGKTFNEWRWEGYLRWYCPQLKTFLGGRAQQVHSIDSYKLQRRILSGTETTTVLEDQGVRWMVIPWNAGYNALTSRAVFSETARWVPVYFDGENTVLANAKLPECRLAIQNCLTGKLRYRDPAIGALSRAFCFFSTVSRKRIPDAANRALAALKESHRHRPIFKAYSMLLNVYKVATVKPAAEIAYLESQLQKLSKMDPHHGGIDVLRCRIATAELLVNLCALMEQTAQRQKNEALAATYRQKRSQAVAEASRFGAQFTEIVGEWR